MLELAAFSDVLLVSAEALAVAGVSGLGMKYWAKHQTPKPAPMSAAERDWWLNTPVEDLAKEVTEDATGALKLVYRGDSYQQRVNGYRLEAESRERQREYDAKRQQLVRDIADYIKDNGGALPRGITDDIAKEAQELLIKRAAIQADLDCKPKHPAWVEPEIKCGIPLDVIRPDRFGTVVRGKAGLADYYAAQDAAAKAADVKRENATILDRLGLGPEIHRLRTNGLTTNQIAQVMDISERTLRTWIKEHP